MRYVYAINMIIESAVLAFALVLLLVGLSATDPRPMNWHAVPQTTQTGTTTNVPDGRCHEDMPCWDCKTMGNLICGRP